MNVSTMLLVAEVYGPVLAYLLTLLAASGAAFCWAQAENRVRFLEDLVRNKRAYEDYQRTYIAELREFMNIQLGAEAANLFMKWAGRKDTANKGGWPDAPIALPDLSEPEIHPDDPWSKQDLQAVMKPRIVPSETLKKDLQKAFEEIRRKKIVTTA